MVYLIAFLCGTSQIQPQETTANWEVLKRFAQANEIAGPHEKWHSWESELEYVRRHYRELRDAPPLADANQLPDIQFVEETREAICRQKSFCVRLLASCLQREQEAILNRIAYLDHLQFVYDAIRSCKNSTSWAWKRARLQDIRDLLGEDYFTLAWPMP